MIKEDGEVWFVMGQDLTMGYATYLTFRVLLRV